MEVKIYREPENQDLIYDDVLLDKHRTLSEELGIPVPVNNTVPNVYIVVNNAMERQLRAVCPSHKEITEYKRSTIPVEVLQAIKFVKDNDMFETMEIWYDEVKPDPILMGYNKISNWQNQYYIIARWGDEALELPELLQLGYNRIKEKLLDSAKEKVEILNGILNDPDRYTRKFISGIFSTYSTALDV